MLKITCPKCGEEIQLGKDTYNALLSEIKTEEVERQIKQKEEDLKKVYEAKYGKVEENLKRLRSDL